MDCARNARLGCDAKMNWPDDIVFAVAGVLCILCLGCGRQRQEFVIKDELRPTTFKELISMNREQIERVDIGRMNLICANEASPGNDIDIERQLRKLDEWAEHCRREEVRFRKKFEKNPKRYDSSYAKFKAINLVLTIKEDFNCRYQMNLVESGEVAKINSPAFFKNYDDVFVSGLLRKRRGTCSSYPVLIVALGRRLGYPISMKATFGHMFCEWNDGVERFNIDTNGEGVDTPTDDWFLKGSLSKIYGIKEPTTKDDYYMRPLDNWESLGFFIETIGYCHEANRRIGPALQVYNLALRYLPNSTNLRRLASRRFVPQKVADHVREVMRFNEEQRLRAERAARRKAVK